MPPIPASNRYNIEASRPAVPIDFDAPYAPTTQTYHGFSIQVDGVTIGRLTSWTPQQLDRAMTHTRELNPRTFGQPVDLVPGIASNFTVSFARTEVWNEEIERALGIAADPYSLLLNQTRPFSIDEVYARGNQTYRRFRYLGCWFSSKNVSAFEAEGDGIIRIDGEITFVNKILV
jgi:hypothetical protein